MAKRKNRERFRDKKSFRRLERIRTKPHIVIACEGEKTEYLYFKDLTRHKRLHSTHITEIVTGAEVGTHPRRLVEGAIAKRRELSRIGIYVEKTYSVFDRNSHANIHEAFDIAGGNGVEIAFSNPCFELWYLIHFDDYNAHIERDNAKRELKTKEGLHDYHASKENVYSLTLRRQPDAIKRAQNTQKLHVGVDRIWDMNPFTNVDELVEYLNSLAESKI